jgi:hypothetical protein
MFDVLAERSDLDRTAWVDAKAAEATSEALVSQTVVSQAVVSQPHTVVQRLHDDLPTFSTISVLLIDTRDVVDGFPVSEQCLRYMSRFECVITRAGSVSAAKFALAHGQFDIVVADHGALDLIAAHKAATIILTDHQHSDTIRRARLAGAQHCLALDDLSPCLLETAISQVLRGESAMA